MQIVRKIPIQRPQGATADIFIGRQEVKLHETVEITDSQGNTLNVAKVTDIYLKDDDRYMTLTMIA